jgi:hypothetical protein
VDIADNIITVNAFNPGVRFGGLAVADSGSSPRVSGSILFDSIKDQWIFVHESSATTSSVLLMGPETYNDLGNETYLSSNRLPKGSGIEHLRDSNITDTGTVVSVNSNTAVTGSFTVITGSAVELQVTNLGVNIGSALTDSHIISGSLRVNPNGLFVSGSGNVGIGTTSPSRTFQVNGYISAFDGTTNTEIISSGGVGYFGTSTNHPLVLQTNNAERMRITSDGNVLIGTTDNAGFKLDVNGSFRTGANGIALDSSGFAVSPNTNRPWNAFRYSHPQNIIPNGDLESWTSGTSTAPDGFGGYDLGASTIVTRESSSIKEGLYSAKISNPTGASFSGMAYDGVRVDKTPSSSGSSSYTISFWYLTPNANGSTSYIGIYDTAANSYSFIESLPKAGVWVFYSRTFSIRDDSDWGINWWVSWGAGTANDVLYVDSIALNKGNQIYNTTRSSVSTTGNVSRWGNFYNLGGNVGIGTTSPGRSLEIYKAGSATAQLKIGDTSTSKGYLGVFSNAVYINAGGTYDGSWSTDGSNGIAGIVLETTNGGSAIAFGTAASNTSPSERMRITAGGNIGINTNSPTTYSLAGRHMELFGGGDYSFFHNNTTTVKSFYAINEASLLAALFTFSNHPLTLGTNNTERMRITAGGSLLVNRTSTVNDATYKFVVKNSTNVNIGFGIQGGESSIESFNDAFSAGLPLRIYGTPLQFYTEGNERMRITSGGALAVGTTDIPTLSTPNGGQLIVMPNAVIVSGIIALGSPYTQNIQIDIVYNNWGGNNVIGLVDMIITLREYANTGGTAFGKVFAVNSGTGATFSSFNTTNVTTSQCTVTASSGGNYTLRITIDPSNVTDRGSFYLTIPNAGGTGSTINSITVSYV